jgi:sulfur relay (sulfurtransferase) complex TusBCD TusD component (DsrE family)
MASISFLFFSGPYQSQACETLSELANAALDKGIEVHIFCYMDAVNSVIQNQKKVTGVVNIEECFKQLVDRGAVVKLCTLCMLVRGTSKMMIDGAKKGGTPNIKTMIEETDRMIVIY